MSEPITLEGNLLFPSDYIGAVDLKGRDVPVTIERIEVQELRLAKGGTKKKPVVFLKGKTKKFVLNKTNARTIAAMYGNEVKGWEGKTITLYPTTTTCGRDTVECVRIRESNPNQ